MISRRFLRQFSKHGNKLSVTINNQVENKKTFSVLTKTHDGAGDCLLFTLLNVSTKNGWKKTQARMFTQSTVLRTISSSSEGRYINSIQENSTKERVLDVNWEDGVSSQYPFVFLRDNCQCPKCFHPDTKSRQIDMFRDPDFNDIVPKNVVHDKDYVTITWLDDHKSTFDRAWLEERKFPETREDVQPTTLHGTQPIPWNNAKLAGKIPVVEYKDLMSSNDVLIHHLENMIQYGLSLVKNAPTVPNQVLEIGKRMSSNMIRITHYG